MRAGLGIDRGGGRRESVIGVRRPRDAPQPPAAAPWKPSPASETVALLRLSAPAESIARMPPVLPSQALAVRPELRLAVEYCGTRTTWKVCWVVPAVAGDAW